MHKQSFKGLDFKLTCLLWWPTIFCKMAAFGELVGRTLGHYVIIEHIGSGGMGVVYRAHDEQLDRDVAMKILPPFPPGTLTNEAARKRFRREALALAKVNHPNIGAVYEFSSQDGMDFLVMELIRGITLDSKLITGALSETEVVQLGMQMAEGLEAAHEQHIVHRDIKPGNLRITPEGRLKILDFGLAQLLEPQNELAVTTSLTQSQEVTGTLPYMAPEQLRGDITDARSDVWAVGAVLYEMATGQRPFDQKVPIALADDIMHKQPLPPKQLRHDLSGQLQLVIHKCLEKEPSMRYQSARELRTDLTRLNAGRGPLAARRTWLWPAIAILSLILLAVPSTRNLIFRVNETVGTSKTSIPDLSKGKYVAVLPFRVLGDEKSLHYVADGL
jgi:serine/threonine protein kinase